MKSDTKMVILVRKDLAMPTGKVAAQCAHAALKVFIDRAIHGWDEASGDKLTIYTKAYVRDWLAGSYAKVCLAVNSEEELDALVTKAIELGIWTTVIVDEGRTVLNGQNKTVAAIGPWDSEQLDSITGHLKLYR